jgi:hypothetical protein
MSRFTRQYLRIPRPTTLFGIISLQTGTELISLALVFNKVTGVYGLLAILTGYQLSLLQFTTYVYSIGILGLLIYLIPHIRRQSPLECLGLAWLYTIDTAITAAYTALFGLDWYFASQLPTETTSSRTDVPGLVAEGLDGIRRETQVHGKVVPQETATSMLLIVGLTLIRVYFSLVVLAYARHALQRYIQSIALEYPEGTAEEETAGPFAEDLPDGAGRRGRLGRLMVSYGRAYWLEQPQLGWTGASQQGKTGAGTLAGEV